MCPWRPLGLPFGVVARFLFPLPLHLSPRPQRVRAALGGGRKKRRFGTAECRVTIWPYFWLICPPCPLDHPNSTPKFRGWRKAGASTFFLFQEARRSHDETSFGSCSGGEDVASLALLASLGLTTTLVHEKKHEGQHRGKNDRRASQDIKVVRGHEKHSTYDGQHLPRPRPRSSATSEGPSKRSGPRRGFHQLAFMPNDPTSSPLSGPSHEALDRRRTKHASESLDGRAQVLHANSL